MLPGGFDKQLVCLPSYRVCPCRQGVPPAGLIHPGKLEESPVPLAWKLLRGWSPYSLPPSGRSPPGVDLVAQFGWTTPSWCLQKNKNETKKEKNFLTITINAKTTLYLVSKSKENQSKIATVRVPESENAKWLSWGHQIKIFKNRKKIHKQMSVRSLVQSFIKIGSTV